MKKTVKPKRKRNLVKPVGEVAFQVQPHMENLMKLRAENPKAFSILQPATRITLEYYLHAKAKYFALQS